MANLIAAASGNFTSSSTWCTVDSASELDSESTSRQISTANSDSATFVPASSTIDGVALKLRDVTASPSGTLTVQLKNNTSPGNREAALTINVADLPVFANTGAIAWVFFKFTSTAAANGTDSYFIRVFSSTNSSIDLYTNATTANFSRKLRTTTTQAPASGNHLVISNEMTGAGTHNTLTVTMDNTASTSFGPTVSGGPPQGIVISNGATMTLGTASSTAYVLKWKGLLYISGGGTLNLASSGGRLASSSTCDLICDSVANVDTGICVEQGGTLNAYGATKTVATLLTANAASTSTGITVGSTTNWAATDVLAFASTTRTYTQSETKIVSVVNSSVSVTLTAGLTNAHNGTSPTQGEVINLTRNIKIHGTSTSLNGYIKFLNSGAANCSYVEFYNLGGNGNPTQGITLNATGTILIEFCALHDFTSSTGAYGIVCSNNTNNFTLDHNVAYNIYNSCFYLGSGTTSTTNWSITNNTAIFSSNRFGFELNSLNGTFTGNTAAGCSSNGVNLTGFADAAQTGLFGSVGTLTAHSNNGVGIVFSSALVNCSISTLTTWLNNNSGMTLSFLESCVFTTITAFGNANNYNVQATQWWQNVTFNNCVFAGHTSFSTTYGIGLDVEFSSITLNSCSFDPTSSPYTQLTCDFDSGNANFVQVQANNCLFNPTGNLWHDGNGNGMHTWSSGGTAFLGYRVSFLAIQNYNQTAGDHRYYTPLTTNKSDSVIYKAASPSERVIPNSSVMKSYSGAHQAAIQNGATLTVSVWIRRSSSGDSGGVNYAGNAPRLIVKRNDSIGITSDTVLATSSGSNGSWEQLSGTTSAATTDGVIEVYVDCDGVSGAWVNVDDWAAA